MKLLLDPLKQRLILGLYDRHEAVVNDLCDICPDIPRSTIYRHMSKMEKENVVTVVRTARKRGTVEKTFVFNEELFGKPDAPPNKDAVSILFSRFCMEYLRRCGDCLDGHLQGQRKIRQEHRQEEQQTSSHAPTSVFAQVTSGLERNGYIPPRSGRWMSLSASRKTLDFSEHII
ncbi:MAG: hypothetical protein MJZ68_07300 [archaeon]|nr:hypothetical protein [archaeon]